MEVVAPFAAKVVELEAVPDEVFATGMLGGGVALWPQGKIIEVRAPLSGTLASWHPHACVIVGADEIGVLLHLGLDTVQARGRGFSWQVQKGDRVDAGDLLATWDTHETQDYLPLTPVVAMDHEQVTRLCGAEVAAGEALYRLEG